MSRRDGAAAPSDEVSHQKVLAMSATDIGGRRGGWRTDRAARVVWAATLPDDGATGGFFGGRPLVW